MKAQRPQTVKNKFTLIIERDNRKIWGRVSVEDNLLIDSAGNLQALERKMKKLLKDFEGLEQVEFEHAYDLTFFFEKYDFLNQSKIAANAGLHPSLIRQYSTGHKTPSREQVQKIERAVRTLGRSMVKVKLAGKQYPKTA